MQVNGYGGVSAYNPYAKTNSANQTSKTNTSSQMKSVQMPEFGWGKGLIATKTETSKTDDEIKNALIELAKSDARKGVNSLDYANPRQSKEFTNLVGDYVQSVSPDRKSIYPAAIAQMGKATKLNGTTPLIDNSLTQLMLNGSNINLKNLGVMYDAKSKMMEINHVEFFTGNTSIGSYDMGRGWHQEFTEQELSRRNEVNMIYYNAWAAETKQIEKENK